MFLNEYETHSICGAGNLDILNCRKKEYSRFFFSGCAYTIDNDFLFRADVFQKTIMTNMTPAEISIWSHRGLLVKKQSSSTTATAARLFRASATECRCPDWRIAGEWVRRLHRKVFSFPFPFSTLIIIDYEDRGSIYIE